MDYLKQYVTNGKELETFLKTVHGFSKEIKIKFGLEKCNKETLNRGILVEGSNI